MITICMITAAWAVIAQDTTHPQPELLPGPADWRFEHIDFPLPFAPDLKHQGFEELRFAPGMFDAEAETYFTYIFALKITDGLKAEPATLETFLEVYYRGLCKAVIGDKDVEFDPALVQATVEPWNNKAAPGKQFQATLKSFDPFVTNKPFELYLDIVVIERAPDDHRLFAAVSPKPRTAPVWKSLREHKADFEKRTAKQTP